MPFWNIHDLKDPQESQNRDLGVPGFRYSDSKKAHYVTWPFAFDIIRNKRLIYFPHVSIKQKPLESLFYEVNIHETAFKKTKKKLP